MGINKEQNPKHILSPKQSEWLNALLESDNDTMDKLETEIKSEPDIIHLSIPVTSLSKETARSETAALCSICNDLITIDNIDDEQLGYRLSQLLCSTISLAEHMNIDMRAHLRDRYNNFMKRGIQ